MANGEQNTTAIPSQAWNNPMLGPFLGLEAGEALELGEVPTDTNVVDDQSGMVFTPQGANNLLMRFRAEFPYVPVIPFPPQVRTVALAANVAQDIEIPDGVVACLFRGSSDYYISNHGRAEIPVDTTSKSLYRPDGIMFFTGGIRSLSVIAPAACIVTLLGYAPQEMPRYGG